MKRGDLFKDLIIKKCTYLFQSIYHVVFIYPCLFLYSWTEQ